MRAEIVPIPHHIKAVEMPGCKECPYYEPIDAKSFFCRRRNKAIKVVS